MAFTNINDTFHARFATCQEIQSWDKYVTNNPNGGNVLQSSPFAKIKSQYGWKPIYIVYENYFYKTYNLILEKQFSYLGKLWYMIKGPALMNKNHLMEILKASKSLIKKYQLKVFLLKIEPEINKNSLYEKKLLNFGLIKSSNIQSNTNTAIIKLNYDNPAALLKSFPYRGRYAIKRALKNKIQVIESQGSETDYRNLFHLMQLVQKRSKINLRPYTYYRNFWSIFISSGYGKIYFVYENDTPSVGAFIIHYGEKATYKDGGSILNRKQYGDSHLIHWIAINKMRYSIFQKSSVNKKIKNYDLCGTPSKKNLNNKNHQFYGLGIFKSSFTKNIVEYIGVYDLPIKIFNYFLWKNFYRKIVIGKYFY